MLAMGALLVRIGLKPTPPLFKYRHYQAEIILLCVRWYLRYVLSYRDLEGMMVERGLSVDHTTIYRSVQHYAPILEKRCRAKLKPTRTRPTSRLRDGGCTCTGRWTPTATLWSSCLARRVTAPQPSEGGTGNRLTNSNDHYGRRPKQRVKIAMLQEQAKKFIALV